MRKVMLAACLALALLVGCAGLGKAPVYPHDQVVLQVAHGGGFRMIDRVSNEIPDVTIWGDGRVVFAALDGTVREGRLDEKTVGSLVGSATFLYGLKDEYAAVGYTDAPMATFTIYTDKGRKTVSVYGLDPVHQQDGDQVPKVSAPLRGLWAKVYAALPADAPELKPTDVNVIALGDQGANLPEWPVELQGRLTGEQARRAVELAGLGEAKLFMVGGQVMRVLVVPVLPGPGAWE